MANPYEWSDERDERGEQDARRAARRHAEQERTRPPHRQDGDYGAGWYGQDAAADGYSVPGPYGRPSERRGDPADFDRYDRDDRREPRGELRSFEAEAARAKHSLERGWRRFSHGLRQAFEEERSPADRDPRRGGGMLGGQDRPSSLFSHDDGLGGRRLGPHRGKGPRGYVRSDDRILEEISDRLAEDDRLDASDIEIKVEAGEVTLNGRVSSREDKRRAEDLAEQVSGVKHIQNNLRAKPPESAAPNPVQSSAQPGPEPAAGGAPLGEPVPRPN